MPKTWDKRRSVAGKRACSPIPKPSTRIAQPRRDPVDRQMNPAVHARVGVARAVPLDQLDLQVVQRIEVGEAVLDRARQQRVVRQPFARRR